MRLSKNKKYRYFSTNHHRILIIYTSYVQLMTFQFADSRLEIKQKLRDKSLHTDDWLMNLI
jgi:hypothetical protein